ncbi:lipase [Shewanella sp. UCD-FRSSP16_17]|uniref:lipase family protein n=1 Tax=Shewanella sp. UCD-FRSSP16_17 TaxID=1853256 RepID=UPI0007EEA3CD|nr:lipase family protein [Shewanella sp. UCD-FRSSP16_17]OBT07018.1 lipase [Shewanella sp. UCD-FRSSP16_17]
MGSLTPQLVAELSNVAYQATNNSTGFFRVALTQNLSNHFNFNSFTKPVMGTSGGFVAKAKNQQTGFALVGQGKSEEYRNDIVIAVRGTNFASLNDLSTDARASTSSTERGALVHAGFNSVFESMKTELSEYINLVPANATLHCVGHSLGGAIATLIADWAKQRLLNVKLYSIGAPKVGFADFALKNTNSLGQENIFRCTKGCDPVPMVPVWPFVHAPYNGYEYRVDNSGFVNPIKHKVKYYMQDMENTDWNTYQRKVSFNSHKRVTLDARLSHQVSRDLFWMNRLSEALLTLLRQLGNGIASRIQSGIANGLNFYDQIAMVLSDVTLHNATFTGQLNGLLAHMLVFAGHKGHQIKTLTFDFIRWVFEQTIKTVNRLAREALS